MKKLLMIVSFVFLVFLLWFLINHSENNSYSNDAHVNIEQPSKNRITIDEKTNNNEEDSFDFSNFNSRKNLDINRASYEREGKVYPNYDEETLVAMADQWDVQAIKELAYRYLSGKPPQEEGSDVDTMNRNMEASQKWIDKRNKYIKDAIIHGDKEFLVSSSMLFPRKVDFSNPDDIRKLTLHDLAFSEFLGMRGNYSDKYFGAMAQIELYQTLHGPLNLTPDDKQYIYDQARIMYDSFEEPRIEMGLGPFDNTIPDHYIDDSVRALKDFQDKVGNNAF